MVDLAGVVLHALGVIGCAALLRFTDSFLLLASLEQISLGQVGSLTSRSRLWSEIASRGEASLSRMEVQTRRMDLFLA